MELKKGETIMIDAALHMSASLLHEGFSDRSGVPLDFFELYFRGKRLEGEATLASWGVGKGSTIEVKMRGRGGAPSKNPGSGRPAAAGGGATDGADGSDGGGGGVGGAGDGGDWREAWLAALRRRATRGDTALQWSRLTDLPWLHAVVPRGLGALSRSHALGAPCQKI